MFDTDGNELPFVIFDKSDKHFRARVTEIGRVSRYMWFYYVYSFSGSPNGVKRSLEAPNLYYGSMHNCLGQNAKSALYQAVPARAENIRVKRGNGVLDCGAYKFPFVDRYVTEEERISLDYSFLLD